jgi:hypothetical protein
MSSTRRFRWLLRLRQHAPGSELPVRDSVNGRSWIKLGAIFARRPDDICPQITVKTTALALALGVAGTIASCPAHAQLKIDVSRVTCTEFLAMQPDQARAFSGWMSGYFNQKSGRAVIDFAVYEITLVQLKEWCVSHPENVVMKALERIATPSKSP